MESSESRLFELAQTCDDVEKLRKSLDRYEFGSPRLDENQNELPPDTSGSCERGDVSRLRDEDGRNILHHCVANRKSQRCFAYLLRKYPQLLLAADYQGRKNMAAGNFRLLLHALDNELHSCLHWAVVCLEDACLQVLLQAAAEDASGTGVGSTSTSQHILTARDMHGATPLHYAAQAGSKRMRALSAGGGSGGILGSTGRSKEDFEANEERSNSMAGEKEDILVTNKSATNKKLPLRILKRILQCGQVSVDSRDNEGRTPLLWAASSGENEAIMELLNANADVNAQDREGLTALHCAASKGHVECIETLINYGNADLLALDKLGACALHYAATFGQLDATKLLLSNECPVDAVDFRGRTVVHCAASRGQYLICRMLAEEYDADLWKTNAKGELPLHDAVRSGRKELVRWLLALNPSAVNAANNFGRTCLHLAAQANSVELCKLLLDYGASVNALMKQRGFPLDSRVEANQYVIAQPLTNDSLGGRRSHLGISMVTPLDLALQRNYRNCARFLMLNGAFPAARLGLNGLLSKSNPNLDSDGLPSALKLPTAIPTFDSATFAAGPTMFDWARNPQHPPQMSGQSSPLSRPFPLDSQRVFLGQTGSIRPPRSQSQPTGPMMGQAGQLVLPELAFSPHPPHSLIEYEAEESRAQSIVTNVYVNCGQSGHRSRRVGGVRRKRNRLTGSVSCHNLNQSNGQSRTGADALITERLTEDRKQANFENQKNEKDELKSRNVQSTSLMTQVDQDLDHLNNIQIKSRSQANLYSTGSSDRSLGHDIDSKQINNSETNPSDSYEESQTTKLANLMQAEISIGHSSRCSHRLHHRQPIDAKVGSTKIGNFKDVKPKVDTRNALVTNKTPTPKTKPISNGLPRSKSNLEQVDVDELDEKAEVVQTAQKSVRKYQIERKIFQELQDLKRYQIRSNQVNESVFVKRLAEQFSKNCKQPGMADFCGPYTYKLYEKYLYDQLRKLSSSNEGKVLPVLKTMIDEPVSKKLSKTQPSMIPRRVPPAMVNFALASTTMDQQCSMLKAKKPTVFNETELVVEQKDNQLTQTLMHKTDQQDHADETLQDISSSMSEEEMKELKEDLRFATQEEEQQDQLEQNLVQKLVQAEMDSIQTVPTADSIMELMKEMIQPDIVRTEPEIQQSDQLVEEIQVSESKVEAEKQDETKQKDEGEEDDEYEDEKLVTAKFIGVKADELDKQVADKGRLLKATDIDSLNSSVSLSESKKPKLSERIGRFSKQEKEEKKLKLNVKSAANSEDLEKSEKEKQNLIKDDVPASPSDFENVQKPTVIEPVITIKKPQLGRQVSLVSERSILRRDSKDTKRSETQIEDSSLTDEELDRLIVNGPRRSSVVRFADSIDEDLEQSRRVYNKTPVHQFSLERSMTSNEIPDQEKEEELIVKVQPQKSNHKNNKEPDMTANEEKLDENVDLLATTHSNPIATKTTTEDEEVAIEEYGEEEPTVDDKDSSLDQVLVSDEEAMHQQVKREKLQLIENIERSIRKNLENESTFGQKEEAPDAEVITMKLNREKHLAKSEPDLFKINPKSVELNLFPDEPRSAPIISEPRSDRDTVNKDKFINKSEIEVKSSSNELGKNVEKPITLDYSDKIADKTDDLIAESIDDTNHANLETVFKKIDMKTEEKIRNNFYEVKDESLKETNDVKEELDELMSMAAKDNVEKDKIQVDQTKNLAISAPDSSKTLEAENPQLSTVHSLPKLGIQDGNNRKKESLKVHRKTPITDVKEVSSKEKTENQAAKSTPKVINVNTSTSKDHEHESLQNTSYSRTQHKHIHHHHQKRQQPYQSTAKHEQYRSLHPPSRRVCLKTTIDRPPADLIAHSLVKKTEKLIALPARYRVNVDQKEIRQRWERTKKVQRAQMQHMRRSQSNPTLKESEAFELLYELRPPRWARGEVSSSKSKNANIEDMHSGSPSSSDQLFGHVSVFESEHRERLRWASREIDDSKIPVLYGNRLKPWDSTYKMVESESRCSSRLSEWESRAQSRQEDITSNGVNSSWEAEKYLPNLIETSWKSNSRTTNTDKTFRDNETKQKTALNKEETKSQFLSQITSSEHEFKFNKNGNFSGMRRNPSTSMSNRTAPKTHDQSQKLGHPLRQSMTGLVHPIRSTTRFTSECHISADGRSLICVNECHRTEKASSSTELESDGQSSAEDADQCPIESKSQPVNRQQNLNLDHLLEDDNCDRCAVCHKLIVSVQTPECAKRTLRKHHSDSALELRICEC